MFEQFPDVLTVKQVADLLHVGRNTAYQLVRSGAIPSVIIGRQIRVSKASIVEFINKGKTA